MEKEKKIKRKKAETGITLIALVITVIIIIILSTAGISMLFGEDGILNIAQNAKRETEIENIREKLEMAKGVAAIDGHGKIDPDHYFDILEEEGIIGNKENYVEEKEEGRYEVTTEEGYIFEVEVDEEGDLEIDYIGKGDVLVPIIREIKVLETSSNSVKIEVITSNAEDGTYTYSAKELPNGEWQEKGTSSDNIYTIEGLTSEKAYTIKVKVETNKGSDEEEIGVTIGDLPTGIITFGDTTWANEQASVIISTESSYRLQYQINGIDEGNWTEIQSGQAVTGLSLGQTLYARLWDGTNGGEEASVDIEDKIAPTVTVTRGTVTSNSIGVSVIAQDNESGMKESLTYTYYIKQTSQADTSYTTEATDITSSSYTFNGLTQGTSYDIKVEVKADKAENAGTGTLLNQTTGTVTSGLEEGAITFGDTTWANEQASVTISTESSYRLQYQINGIDEGSWTEIQSGEAVTGLSLGQTLYARLWDGTNGGEHASVDIEDKTPPTVDIETSNLTHNSVTLTVTASDNESGLAETNRYTYYLNNVPQVSNNTASYNYTGLHDDTTYTLKVVVLDKGGNSTEKETTIKTILAVPGTIEDAKPDSTDEDIYIYEETTQISDASGDTLYVPGGFGIASDSATDIDDGVVITDGTNEFVWIPVSDADLAEMYSTTDPDSAGDTALSKSTLNEEATTTKIYSKIRGKTGGAPGSTSFREPDILVDTDRGDASTTDGYGINLIKSELGYEGDNATVLKNFAQDMVNEYRAIFDSIKQYDGFYIGRYELTGTANEPTVQRYQPVLTADDETGANTWYGLKDACSRVVNSKYAKSHMIYGNQWDEVMDWLVDTQARTEYEVNEDSSSWGNYSNYSGEAAVEGYGERQESGHSDAWSANNIYDLAGNYYEWTQEAEGAYHRVRRGRLLRLFRFVFSSFES